MASTSSTPLHAGSPSKSGLMDGKVAGASASNGNAGSPPPGHTSSKSKKTITLVPEVMSAYKAAKVWRDKLTPDKTYTSVAFHESGDFLVACTDDEKLMTFDCRRGQISREIKSGKYGGHLARFTHASGKSGTLIHASSKGEDHAIRQLALHDSKYLQYHQGHKRTVTSLEMSPADDSFLSGAADDTVRLWDVRTKDCQGLLNVAGTPSVAYDPSGTIFAVTLSLNSTTSLYDIRKLDVEPFAEIPITDPILARQGWPLKTPVCTSVKFSNDGTYILVGTASGVHYVLHSFDYKVAARLVGPAGLAEDGQDTAVSGEETSWTPDGRFVLSGSRDGKIYMWDVTPPEGQRPADRPPPGDECTLQPFKVLDGHRNSPSRAVRYNPKFGMFASAGMDEMAFWLPDPGSKEGTAVPPPA